MTIDRPKHPSRESDATVIMFGHEHATGKPDTFPACRDLLEYWDGLRAKRQMPARSEFDPRGIEQTLACTFVAEKVAPSVARIRVSGSVLNDTLGMDVRGMPITALFDPTMRDAVSEAIRDLFANPSKLELDLSANRRFGRTPMRALMLLLLMSDAEGQLSRLVSCLDIVGGLGKTPRRFQLDNMRSCAVHGDAPVAIEDRGTFRNTRPESLREPNYGFAEAPTPFVPNRKQSLQDKAKASGLRLVVSND